MSPTRALASRDCRLPRRRQNCHQFVCFLLKGCEGRPVRLAGDGEFVKPASCSCNASLRVKGSGGSLRQKLMMSTENWSVRGRISSGVIPRVCCGPRARPSKTGMLPLTGYLSTNYKFLNPNRQMPQSRNLQQSSDRAIANSAIHDLHIGRSFLMRDSSVTHMLSIRGKKE